MNVIEVICKNYRKVSVSDSQLTYLKQLYFCASAYSNFLSQYQVFCRSLSDFKKLVYSRAIDADLLMDSDYFNNVSLFVDAENSTMHATASFVKFTDILPSLLQNCFPDSGTRDEVISLRRSLYDDESGNYRFLCELRNAIVHNRVNITVTRGSTREVFKSDTILKFGYLLDFEYFVDVCVDKPNKKDLLLQRRERLAGSNGKVDIVKTLSDAAASVFINLIAPYVSPLRSAMAKFKENSENLLIGGNILESSELDDVYLLHDSELLYSSLMNMRAFELAKNIRTPISATTVNIAPSIIK